MSVEVPVLSGYDLNALAGALRTAINNLDGYSAIGTGTEIEVSPVGLNSFTVGYAVARSFADTPSTVAGASTIGIAQGVPLLNEIWRVTSQRQGIHRTPLVA